MFFADALHVFQPIVIGDIILRPLIAAKRLFWGKRIRRVIHLVWLLTFGAIGAGAFALRDLRCNRLYRK